MASGDTLYICGTHKEILIVGISGTESRSFTIRGDYDGAAGIISGEDTRTECIKITSKDYVTVKNITLNDPTVSCMLVEGTSMGILGDNISASGSGNQAFQHLDTANASYINCTADGNIDDGFSCHGSAEITATNCIISNNAEGLNLADTAKITAIGCTFTGNTSYDAVLSSGEISISNSVLSQNIKAEVTGILTLNGCLILGTVATFGGGAIVANKCYFKNYVNIAALGDGDFKNCYFDGGALNNHIINTYSTVDFLSCVFKSVTSNKYAIVFRLGSVGTLNGCTFIGNNKTGDGFYTLVNVTVNNCIFTKLGVAYNNSGGTSVTYNCCFYDNTTLASGTVTQNYSQTDDPVLSDIANNDFSLGSGSCCIGTGKDLGDDYDDGIDTAAWGDGATTVPVVTTKVQAAAWDIGAYIS